MPRWKIAYLADQREVSVGGAGGLDEIVIDDWFHLEKMDRFLWWIRICDARVCVDCKVRDLVAENAFTKPKITVERDFYEPPGKRLLATWRVGYVVDKHICEIEDQGLLVKGAIGRWLALKKQSLNRWELRIGTTTYAVLLGEDAPFLQLE